MPINAFHVNSKSIDDHSVAFASTVSIGHAVNYVGAQISTAGVAVHGIALQDGTSGVIGTVAVMGTCPAKVGAAVAVGAALATDTSGRLVTATEGQFIFARALQAAGAANEFIEVLITREGKA